MGDLTRRGKQTEAEHSTQKSCSVVDKKNSGRSESSVSILTKELRSRQTAARKQDCKPKSESLFIAVQSSVQQQQQQPGHFTAADRRLPTHYATTVHERFEEFSRYFVRYAEEYFQAYYCILEGELKKSGKLADTYSGLIGLGVGGVIGGIIGLFVCVPPAAASALAKAGKRTGEYVGSKLGERSHKTEVCKLSDLVYDWQKNKARFREILVEGAFDVFQSFEMQFMRVSVKEMPKKAMRRLAKDAVNRLINYLKNTKQGFISEGVICGHSKKHLMPGKSAGFEIEYKYDKSEATWKTGSLYTKVGLLVIRKDQIFCYKKRDSKINTGKYRYRRVLDWESWDKLKEKYDVDNIAESESKQLTNYEYVFSLEDMDEKCRDVLQKIDLDDPNLKEKRMTEIFEESRNDIIEELNDLKQRNLAFSEADREILTNIDASIRSLKIEDHLKTFKEYFEAAAKERRDMAMSVDEAFEDAHEHREKIAEDNKKQLESTQAGVKELNEKLEKIGKGQETSSGLMQEAENTLRRLEKQQFEMEQKSKETSDNVKHIKQKVEKLVGVQQPKDRIWFDMRDCVKFFTGREEELGLLDQYMQQGTVVIKGLRGVGKSELAMKYARTYCHQYSSAVWVNAETCNTTKLSFHRLYKKMGFAIKDEDGEEKDLKSIAEDVYDCLGKRKSLFIFDNFENYVTVKDVFPAGLPDDVIKPDILITAANKADILIDITAAKVLPLGDFTPKDSTEFIKKFLTKNNYSHDDGGIEELAQKLCNFPLALQQAMSYITKMNNSQKNVDPESDFTIRNYLEQYEGKAEELLKYKVFQNIGSGPEETKATFTAVQLTLSRIRTEENGQKALEILNMMSYFAPDNIPAKVFLEFVNGNKRDLGTIIQLLKEYSIVTNKGLLSMHGLVQEVIRLELEKEDGTTEEEKVLYEILRSLNKHLTDYKTTRDYVPHLVSVWNYARKYFPLVENFIINDDDNQEKSYASYFHVIAESSPFETVEDILNKIKHLYPSKLVEVIKRESKAKVTPLHCAAMGGDVGVVKLLIEQGANVTAQAKHNWTPLHFAAKNGSLESFRVLLNERASIDDKTEYGFTPLHLAAKGGHKEIVDILLAKVDAKTNRGFTPLHLAVDSGREEIVTALLGKGADVNDKTGHGKTPLHLAAKGGHVGIFNALLAKGASIEAKTLEKWRPLHIAAQNGHLKIVQALLRQNADVNVKDGHRFTPLHVAAANGHKDIVILLLNRNADVDAKTSKGNTPLHLAAEKGYFEIAESLIMKNANVDIKNHDSKTALDFAIKGNHLNIKNYIIQHIQNRGIA